MARAARWATGRSVGLALSSGGSKAVAHLGVLRALAGAGIEIDACTGSSGGRRSRRLALRSASPRTGKWSACSISPKATSWRHLDFNFPPRTALFKGRRLRSLFGEWGGDLTFADAVIPLWMVAADVATGAEIVIDEGLIADALRASMSVPGAFDPWWLGDRLLIDGAVVNPLPTNVLRDAGVGIVIASNVAGQASEIVLNQRLPGLLQVIGRMINAMEREVIRNLLPLADVVIRPRVEASSTFDFGSIDEFVKHGVDAANDRILDVLALLSAAGAAERAAFPVTLHAAGNREGPIACVHLRLCWLLSWPPSSWQE